MTIYRPIVIIENTHGNHNIRIEICRDTGSRSISPFIRKVDIDDIWQKCVKEVQPICELIEQCCDSRQPFLITGDLLEHQVIQQFINTYPFLYSSINGSLKRLSVTQLKGKHKPYQCGRVVCGELYVESLNEWRSNIAVRFRYEDARNSFHAEYSCMPFATVDNRIFLRDKNAEERLLQVLGKYSDGSSRLVGAPSIDDIKYFCDNGWRIFLSKSLCKEKKAKGVYFHTSRSGIEWLSSDVEENEMDFLDAYLKNRNYLEFGKGIALLDFASNPKKIKNNIGQLVIDGGLLSTGFLNEKREVISEDERKKIRDAIAHGFIGNLKDYQTEGVFWLHEMKKNHTGCLLADEMGLGKTIQVLAYLASSDDDESKSIIVCPASLKYNWESEILKFTPTLCNRIDIVSFDTLVYELNYYGGTHYSNIIVDEGQFVKNPNTKRFGAINGLNGDQTIILTGTPIENSIEDVWAYFSILIPQLSTIHKLLKEKSKDISRFVEVSGMVLHPFILRRTKKDVLSDLPEKIEETIYVTLSTSEKTLYERIRRTFVKALSLGVGGRINSIALEALLRLRQACVCPSLLPFSLNPDNENESSKISLAIAYIKSFKAEGHKTILFTQFASIMPYIENILKEEGIGYVELTGSTADRKSPVEAFQRDGDKSVFLISLKAGGTGLNLTAADRIILLDDWWNPAVEEQAMGRAHRIGQKNPVLVLRLICKDTVEEKILQLQNSKQQCANDFNDTKGTLSISEIMSVLGDL